MHPAHPPTATFNILFVCTGNTCRSPMAEAAARDELGRRGWNHVRVASAGVAARDGSGPSEPALRVSEQHGLNLGNHRSRSVSPRLLEWADLVLAMSPGHVARLERHGAAEKTALLTDFASGGAVNGEILDPYGGDDALYTQTLRELRGLVSGALDRLAPILAP